jgi:hypothetical protein
MAGWNYPIPALYVKERFDVLCWNARAGRRREYPLCNMAGGRLNLKGRLE